MGSRRPRFAFAFAPLVALLVGAPLACDKGGESAETQGDAAEGDAAAQEQDKRARVRVDAAQSFTPRSRSRHLLLLQANRRSTLSPRVGGQVRELRVAEQDSVEAGDVLLELSDVELRGAYTSASAGVSSARAQLADTKKELADAKRLQAQGAETNRRVEQLETQVKTLEATLRQAKGSLTQAKDRKEGSQLVAPFTGVITDRLVEVGEYLGPGAPALVLAELDPLMVEVPLAEREVARQGSEGGLEFVAEVRGAPQEAQLKWVAREADPGTATFAARLSIPNPEGALRAGESVNVQVLGPVMAPVVTIDVAALRWEGKAAYVLRLEGESLRRVDIELGRDLGDRVVVAKGVEPGQEFVTRGLSTLVDGDAVVVVRDEAARAEPAPPPTPAEP